VTIGEGKQRRGGSASRVGAVVVGIGFSWIALGFIAKAGTWPAGDGRNTPAFVSFCWLVALGVGPAIALSGLWRGRTDRSTERPPLAQPPAAPGLITRLKQLLWLAPDPGLVPPLIQSQPIDKAGAQLGADELVLWRGRPRAISTAFWRFAPFSFGAILIVPIMVAFSDMSAGWPRYPGYLVAAVLVVGLPVAVHCLRTDTEYLVTNARVLVVRPVLRATPSSYACECRLSELPPAESHQLPFGRGTVTFGSQWIPRYHHDSALQGIIPARPLVFLAIRDPRGVADLINRARADAA
jgi:hypothetical protein